MDQSTTPQAGTPDDGDLDAFLGVKPASRRGRLARLGIVAMVLLLALWGISRIFFTGEAAAAYATDPLTRGNLTVSVSATGNLAPTNQVDVGSELSGLVTRVLVDNNDRVTRGQVLAILDPSRLTDTVRQSDAALNSAQAQVLTAQATVAQTGAAYRRLQEVYRLSGGKVPSGTELDTGRADLARAQAQVRTAQAAVAQARAQLSSDRTQLSKTRILSPVNGVVLLRQIEPGATVAASLNAPVLFVIAEDLSQMRLEVKVDEADVGQVARGQRATFTVDAFPGRAFPAMIERVDVGSSATATSASSTTTTTSTTGTVVSYTARLTVANPDLILRPGMTATADIVTTEKRDVLMVPNQALRFDPGAAKAKAGGGAGGALVMRPRGGGGGATRTATIGRGSRQRIYVLNADGTPREIPVTVGDTDGAQTEVSGAGLIPGMKVITGQLSAEAAKAGTKKASGAQGGGAQGGGGGARGQ